MLRGRFGIFGKTRGCRQIGNGNNFGQDFGGAANEQWVVTMRRQLMVCSLTLRFLRLRLS